MLTYIQTSTDAMFELDERRRVAEIGVTDPARWNQLAQAYDAQGRPSMAERCRQRARHYASVSAETPQQAAYASQ
jgi:YD repeat-containing protein